MTTINPNPLIQPRYNLVPSDNDPSIVSLETTHEDSQFDFEATNVDFFEVPENSIQWGMSAETALNLSNDPGGNVFSALHTQGDPANYYSHAFVSDLISQIVQENGGSQLLGALSGALGLYAKELTDKNLSKEDIIATVLTDLSSGRLHSAEASLSASAAGDVMFGITVDF